MYTELRGQRLLLIVLCVYRTARTAFATDCIVCRTARTAFAIECVVCRTARIAFAVDCVVCRTMPG